ncbi:hypothetical protein LIN78_01885 [Leeia sp. TBRC 13508]|uniref:MotA/TolQ/ExbB proton channel domain-containing protein n=1 Tax=Leeia speluncae TaxID=2884804 RepID=A0ABS8D294_9NEIS|nr:hypothetical protein [Leeia speluncae]MCB6182305.1 hypothetical protein [Leeia speluncae]
MQYIASISDSVFFKFIVVIVTFCTAVGLIIAFFKVGISFYKRKIGPKRKQNQYSSRRLELKNLKRCMDNQSILIATFAEKTMLIFTAFFYTLLTTGGQTVNLILHSGHAMTISKRLEDVTTVLIIIGLWVFIISLAISGANFFRKVKLGQTYLDELVQDIQEMKKQSPELQDTPKVDFLDDPSSKTDKQGDDVSSNG